MKLVKIFGVVVGAHVAAFMFIFAIPGCRSTGKKTVPVAPSTGGASESPVAAAAPATPVVSTAEAPAAELSAVRFSPTRPGTPLAAEVTTPVVVPGTYTVVKGDNFWTIAKKHNITVKQLTATNNLRADSKLSLGQKLVIPGKVATPVAAPAAVVGVKQGTTKAAAPVSVTSHVVKSGESLGGIAKKYQVKVGDIATANNIADPTKIRVGQTLKIPGAHSSAAKPASTATKPAATFTPAAAVESPVSAPAESPTFTSPLLESVPPSPAAESPLITPVDSASAAPVISVEESGAPKIE